MLAQFCLASAVPICLLGFVLAQFLEQQIRERALDQARRSAIVIGDAGVRPLLTPLDFRRGLTPGRLVALDQPLQDALASTGIARVKIWNRRGQVIYSDDRTLIGQRFPVEEHLEEALSGTVASEVSSLDEAENVSERADGRLVEVYVPLRFGHNARPTGVFELYLPYAPLARQIRHETRTVYLLLLCGLGFLYALLFRIVASASRQLRRQAKENEYQALHDALTDLPNRALFNDRVRQAVLAAARTRTRVAIMLMDLDRFKEINDSLGHHCGDELLRQVGTRLRGLLRESDTVGRLGGDEFAILLPDLVNPAQIGDLARRIRDVLENPFDVQGLSLPIEASIGIALYPDHAEDVETLLQRADIAMYVAKAAHSGYQIYAPGDDHHSADGLSLVGELHRAIIEGELVLHYQPKAELESGRVTSVEALVRWRHPERGLLPPVEFIPLAEHTSVIRPLTLHVLEVALAQCRSWRDEGLDLGVAVNIAMRNLLDVNFPDAVAELLERWELEPERLELEITESTIMADPPRALGVLRRLSDLGVKLAIDDFGTGYSSLAYLKQLPIDEIKIDKSFVLSMDADENDAIIVRSTIDLGRNLGLEVVAEGVETVQVWEQLVELGCHVAQGFFLSRPVPAEELRTWLLRDGRTPVPS